MFFRTAERQQPGRTSRAGYAATYALVLSTGIAGVALVGLGSSSSLEPVAPFYGPGLHWIQTAVAEGEATTDEPDVRAVLNTYCVACHNQALFTADLALDTVDASNPSSHPETWEKVITRLRTGTMPPGGVPRPDPETYQAVAEWLEQELDQAWASSPNPNPGRITSVHRLNRTEYNNAIRDLLALDVDVKSQLPGDETADGSFDNMAVNLTISSTHMERYLSVARQVTRLATGLPPAPGAERYVTSDDKRQGDRMSEDLPLGSRGGLAVRHHFPTDGEYVISLRLQENYANYMKGMGWQQEIDVRLDGELLERFAVGGGGEPFRPGPHSYEGAGGGPGWAGSPEWEEYMQVTSVEGLSVRVRVPAGPHLVGVSFPRDVWEDESFLPQPSKQARGQADAFNANRMGYAGVRELHIEGPYEAAGIARDTPSRRQIFICEPEIEAEEEACASRILSRMARRAYRRPVTDEEVQDLLGFFRFGRDDGGSFDHGIQFGLERILADPSFLLRVYRDPPSEQPAPQRQGSGALAAQELTVDQEAYPLSDLEVASRLSFFLWSSIPDNALLDLAEQGRLTDPQVLREQAKRMLADSRAIDALVGDFASQWLTLRRLGDHTLRARLYIDYDGNLREAMGKETELFIASTIREDRSVLDLLGADYTFLNERLARHYKIPNVSGGHFRRVTLPNLEERGGLLGQASLLAVTSYPDRTTPVLRGKWLLENILGMDVPPPPPNVDTSLDTDEPSTASLPIRELLARHRKDPMCASCHSILDPMGFALEGYDAAGGLRTIDEKGNPVDDIGRWPTGVEIEGLSGLRTMLLGQGEQFARTVTAKLMSYAVGRELEYFDRPAVRSIVNDAEPGGFRWSSIILGIVESPQFLTRARGRGGRTVQDVELRSGGLRRAAASSTLGAT